MIRHVNAGLLEDLTGSRGGEVPGDPDFHIALLAHGMRRQGERFAPAEVHGGNLVAGGRSLRAAGQCHGVIDDGRRRIEGGPRRCGHDVCRVTEGRRDRALHAAGVGNRGTAVSHVATDDRALQIGEPLGVVHAHIAIGLAFGDVVELVR